MLYSTILILFHLCLAQSVAGHASIWHPSMLGFNVTAETFPYDNRPVSPLMDMTFDQWWFHGHLAYPPHPEDVFELPAGTNVTTQIGCNKGATDFFASSEGGDIRNGNDPCPGSPPSEYHTNGIDDVKGCALAIAYKDDFNSTQPEDFTVFSVNQTCVWSRFTEFSVPERMPPCPNGKCICAWFWIHSQDSGGEQNYMNGFQCNITNSVSDVPLAKPEVPRRCGADPDFGKQLPAPGNCTYGAKQPFYWFQKERNNMNEGTYAPPFYLDLYGFLDGPQDDIFQDSYANIPEPSDNQTVLPTLKTVVPGQRLAVPDLHLLPSNFLATALAAIPSPTMFVASMAPAAPMTTSSAQATIAASSAQPTGGASSFSSSASSTSTNMASTTSTTSFSTSALSAATVTVTNVVTVVVAVEPEPTATPIASGNNVTNVAFDLSLPGSSSLLAANDTTDPGALKPSTRPRSCTRAPNLLAADHSTPTKRSIAERLGMGTYTKRDIRSRSLWSFW